YYNYKGYFSVVLLAVCDANYKFVLTNCGASGSESDGGIFRRSEIGKRVLNHTLDLPAPDRIDGINTLMPYCFVGDEAFPLLKNLMRPYPEKTISQARLFQEYGDLWLTVPKSCQGKARITIKRKLQVCGKNLRTFLMDKVQFHGRWGK
ncbi:unnamed protein product, partial [Allacma fusca]